MGQWKGKIIGFGLGWAFGGPLGGLIGGFIGNQFDHEDRTGQFHHQRVHGGSATREAQQRGAFAVSLLALCAHVSRADGSITRAEVHHVRDWLVARFGREDAADMMHMYREIIDRDFNIRDVNRQIRENLDYYQRLELTHLLVDVGLADGNLHPREIEVITEIAIDLGITDDDLNSLFGMAGTSTLDKAYQILGVPSTATVEEIKTSYRSLVKKYHPDRVNNLGEEFKELAKQKFIKLQEAYEQIREARGF